MTAPVAEMNDVTRTYEVHGKPVPVLRNLNLTIHRSDRIVLFGPSGCGKTTLLHLLALLDEGNTGSYSLEQENLWRISEAEKARIRAEKIGLIFQRFHLLPFHTVRENILLRARYLPESGPGTFDRISGLLDQMGLTGLADHPVRFLSGGEQQRVCIARACVHTPRLLLADEPTGNLDESNSDRVQNLLRQIADTTPVVLATHDPSWLPFATRVFHFRDGALVEENA
jgi:putative ABC transport system ATP-binding protein